MRKLSKPWPPSNVSPSGQTARNFVRAEQSYLAALPRAADPKVCARSEFDRLDKAKLRQVLFGEQGFVCAYCERRVAEQHPVPPIDHWEPLNAQPRLALHWENLYLSCSTPETCDGAKKRSVLGVLCPAQFDYERHLSYTSRGEIYVRNDTGLSAAYRVTMEAALTTPPGGPGQPGALLNLNHPALVAARAAAVDCERTHIRKTFPRNTAPFPYRQSRAKTMLRQPSLEPFISIRVCWLCNNIGKGR